MISLNTFLWILQAFLGLSFLGMGSLKVTSPREMLASNTTVLGDANDFSTGHVRLIGLAEMLGALGLVEPWATGVAKILTPISAAGLAALMMGAVVMHAREDEPYKLPLVLGVLSAIVAVGRFAALA